MTGPNGDQVQIVLVAAACAAGVGVVGLVAAWLVRHLSIRWQLGLIVLVSIGSVLAGVVAVARLMFLSPHDWEVVSLVAGASGVVALVVALAVGAALARWSAALGEGARLLDTQGSYVADPRGPSELQALAAELERTSERLAESRVREARLEESRRELVSWVSHDLRTPLAGMRAMTEALEDGLAADPDRYHRQIRAEVDRMVRMVDDLFELSRIHAGVLRISPETVMLGDVVSEAIAGADPVARARSVHLGGHVEEGIEVTADAAALSRVMTNLIMNAIRHTPADGSVEIRGRLVDDGTDRGVEISVSDQCGGLSEEDMGRVFDLAWRGGGAARTPVSDDGDPVSGPAGGSTGGPPGGPPGGPGAGLGLAIVKGIVEAHRGAVRVENLEDRGASPAGCRFLVRLPA